MGELLARKPSYKEDWLKKLCVGVLEKYTQQSIHSVLLRLENHLEATYMDISKIYKIHF